MTDIKELNNDELEKVSGGENFNDVRFDVGDWIKSHQSLPNNEVVYYVKDVINDTYNLIEYKHLKNEGSGKRPSLSKCIKRELYNQSYKFYRYPMYQKIEKPTWIKES